MQSSTTQWGVFLVCKFQNSSSSIYNFYLFQFKENRRGVNDSFQWSKHWLKTDFHRLQKDALESQSLLLVFWTRKPKSKVCNFWSWTHIHDLWAIIYPKEIRLNFLKLEIWAINFRYVQICHSLIHIVIYAGLCLTHHHSF